MDIRVYPDRPAMSAHAAAHGAELIRAALAERGAANIIVATGSSQFEMLKSLAHSDGVDPAGTCGDDGVSRRSGGGAMQNVTREGFTAEGAESAEEESWNRP